MEGESVMATVLEPPELLRGFAQSTSKLLHLFSDLLTFLRSAGSLNSFTLHFSPPRDVTLELEQRALLENILSAIRDAAVGWESPPPCESILDSPHPTQAEEASPCAAVEGSPVCSPIQPPDCESPVGPCSPAGQSPGLHDRMGEEEEEDVNIKLTKELGGRLLCQLCGHDFSSKAHLRRHMASHAGMRSHECTECGRRYVAKQGLVSHMLREHGLGEAFTCSECGKRFAVRRELEKHHAAVHSALKPFGCPVCQRSFSQKVTRDAHLALHTGVYPHTCGVCGKGFAVQAKLTAHAATHEPPRFECAQCGRKFARRDCLRQHLKLHAEPGRRPFACTLQGCGRTFRTTYHLASHMQVHEVGSSHMCEICGARFRQKSSLMLHLRKHSPHDLLACCHCGKTYAKPFDLRRHLLSHSQERAYLCEACGKNFKSPGDLQEHRRRQHGERARLPRVTPEVQQEQQAPQQRGAEGVQQASRLYACPACPKVFKTRSRLSTHKRLHSEEQPRYECGTCGKRFHRSDVLRNHELLHTGRRPFSCEHCAKTFASRANLRAHSAVHSAPASQPQFRCEHCAKVYRKNASLVAHRKKHEEDSTRGAEQENAVSTGGTGLTCHVCQRSFESKSALGGHLRSHPNERPFACVLCSKRYKKRKHWKEHVQKSHSDLTEYDSTFTLSEGGGHVVQFGDSVGQFGAGEGQLQDLMVADEALHILEQLAEVTPLPPAPAPGDILPELQGQGDFLPPLQELQDPAEHLRGLGGEGEEENQSFLLLGPACMLVSESGQQSQQEGEAALIQSLF